MNGHVRAAFKSSGRLYVDGVGVALMDHAPYREFAARPLCIFWLSGSAHGPRLYLRIRATTGRSNPLTAGVAPESAARPCSTSALLVLALLAGSRSVYIQLTRL